MYARRLRSHSAQELLAGLGIAVAVALVLSATLAERSISGSARQVVRAVVGPAQLQLRARSAEGFPEAVLARVQHVPGVVRAAPVLEQSAMLTSAGAGSAGSGSAGVGAGGSPSAGYHGDSPSAAGPGATAPGAKGAAGAAGLSVGVALAGAEGAPGRSVRVTLAGADLRLATLDGLGETLPLGTLTSNGIGLTRATAQAIGYGGGAAGVVTLALRGGAYRLPVSAVLGRGEAGALSGALVAVMPLALAQRLAGLPGRVSRIVVQAQPRRVAQVRAGLTKLAGPEVEVAPADEDLGSLAQALGPSDLASGLFAAIGALLGLLLAFNAMLLTVADRRRAIADLRVEGATRATVMEMVLFEALCLGLAGSTAGVLAGWALATGAFHPSTGYLAEAFTLSPSTLLDARAVAFALGGGVLATCLASAVPLLDLRPGRARDAVYRAGGEPGNTLSSAERARLAAGAAVLAVAATVLWALRPAAAIPATALLALATVMAVPLVFAAVLRGAGALAERAQRIAILPLAIASLRATTVRSLALAATGAVALFGSVALGGARENLLQGIKAFAGSYVADADVWVGNPGDNQAVDEFRAGPATVPAPPRGSTLAAAAGGGGAGGALGSGASPAAGAGGPPGSASPAAGTGGPPGSASPTVGTGEPLGSAASPAAGATARRIAGVGGVSRVRAFYGGFLQVGERRVWVIARPPGGADRVLATQLRGGSLGTALARLARGGWITVSEAIADESGLAVGSTLTLPTPTGPRRFRVAATTTNLAWPPGVIFMDSADYMRDWGPAIAPTAFAVSLRAGADPRAGAARIERALGPGSGLEAVAAGDRARRIDALAGEGLGQLREIALLLLVAATLAMAAALASSIWQRRAGLAGLRLLGARAFSVRALLLLEALLMLGAGCVTGAVTGLYGQVVIDAFLRHVTGFPLAAPTTSARPVEIFAAVLAAALALGAVPAWLAARVRPTLALAGE
jgi:putative ABC transport system permease protein